MSPLILIAETNSLRSGGRTDGRETRINFRSRSPPVAADPVNRRGSHNKPATNDRPGYNKVSRRRAVPRVTAFIPTVNIDGRASLSDSDIVPVSCGYLKHERSNKFVKKVKT